jgi:recombination protein U
MNLEKELNASNDYYKETNRALIYKKPTPVQIVRVDYPSRNKARISEAYYTTPSTTDYNGIYRGRAIDFEAKETHSKTSFPFRSIHPHQIEHLKRVLMHGGIGFVIIRFCAYEETYMIDAKYFIEKYEHQKRRSLPYSDVQEHGHLIPESYMPRLNYLNIVDDLYFKEES